MKATRRSAMQAGLALGASSLLSFQKKASAQSSPPKCPAGTVAKSYVITTDYMSVPIEVNLDGKIVGAGGKTVMLVPVTKWTVNCEATPVPPPPPPPPRPGGKGNGFWDPNTFYLSGGIWEVEDPYGDVCGYRQFSQTLSWDVARPAFSTLPTIATTFKIESVNNWGSPITGVFNLSRVGNVYLPSNSASVFNWLNANKPQSMTVTPMNITLGASADGSGNAGVALYMGDRPFAGRTTVFRAINFGGGVIRNPYPTDPL